MPVNVDKNLTLKNNVMDASYGELFKKLNVAYGWTNTQTTSSGGTAVVLVNDGDILTTMECNDINKCVFGYGYNYGSSYSGNFIIINGKIYTYTSNVLQQCGSKSDYATVSGNGATNIWAIDESGKLWYINNNVETQVGTDTSWTSLSYISGSTIGGINNGKIYSITSSTATQQYTNLTNVSVLQAVNESSYLKGFCFNNNYLYYIKNNTATMLGNDNNWKYMDLQVGNSEYAYVINSNNELYFATYQGGLYKLNASNVKKVSASSGYICLYITNDNKLCYLQSANTKYGDNYGQVYDISNGMEWTDISRLDRAYNYLYAISDGKLYKIKPKSSVSQTTYTQIGTESDYQKVEGFYPAETTNSRIGLAWSGDAVENTHTIYTTKLPQATDVTYLDKDLTNYSTVQSTGAGTITDEYRTYNRDVSKDTTFTAIPPATVHETVSTVDFLRITNPNT